ncbi:nuclear transport factor 2 family protein [Thalassococcus lentus]|uniref:Nuclear transport factor 2 family protein n=1 Tax=Thalassococcus lentus TaxID=1210524 RepID=A0ABT4XPY2_9RHOB|nr:nuclear transport factor 2 family protein [Thalassococcus lentus]MDA7423990.1 nuclear transport factor 2 family protein [Thalassococcus lentus]
MKKTLTTLGAMALGTTAALADLEANKQIVIDGMTNAFVRGNTDAVDDYFADPYIQHNPLAASGVDALKGLLSNLPGNPEGSFEPIRIIAEGDLVVTHSVYENFGPVPLVAFDVFRIDNGKIVEHWDNMSPVVEQPNPSGRTQIDGETVVTDLDKTAENKALVEDFINRVLIKGEQVDFTDYINPEKYLQHNTQAGDGLEGLGAFLQYLGENDIAFYYTNLAMVVAEGNFVFAAAEGVFGEQPTAYFDLFRLEDGRIVEHWDVIADMPSGELPEGYPGKF